MGPSSLVSPLNISDDTVLVDYARPEFYLLGYITQPERGVATSH